MCECVYVYEMTETGICKRLPFALHLPYGIYALKQQNLEKAKTINTKKDGSIWKQMQKRKICIGLCVCMCECVCTECVFVCEVCVGYALRCARVWARKKSHLVLGPNRTWAKNQISPRSGTKLHLSPGPNCVWTQGPNCIWTPGPNCIWTPMPVRVHVRVWVHRLCVCMWVVHEIRVGG